MPETTFLQIQGRDQSASRVLELPVGPVRIGRGYHCEVRLGDEPGLGDVQCLLRRRGNQWHFQPVGPPGHVWIDGRPADHQRPVPIGSALRVGDHWLTLRTAASPPDARGSFTMPIAVEPRTADDLAPTPAPAPEPIVELIAEADDPPAAERPRPASTTAEDEDRLRRWQARLEQRERWLKSRQDEREWEARWKAAGETIRGRGTVPSAPPSRPATPPTPAPTPPAPPLDRRPPARPKDRVIEPRAAVPFHRPAEPARRPIPQRVPVRPPASPASPTPRPHPEPVAPTSRSLATIPRPSSADEPETSAVVVVESSPVLVEVIEAVEPPPALEASTEVLAEAHASPASDAECQAVEPTQIESSDGPRPSPEMGEGPGSGPFPTRPGGLGLGGADPGFRVESWIGPVEAPAPQERGDHPGRLLPPEGREDGPTGAIAEPVEAPAVVGATRGPAGALPAVAEVADQADVQIQEAPQTARREAGPSTAEWPSASTIFAARATRPVVEPTAIPGAKRRVKVGPMPTDAVAPAHWTLPFWLGWPTTAMAAMVVGVAGLGLAWAWTVDAMAMNDAVRFALRPEGSTPPTIESATIPHPPWWQTTTGQMAAWAIAVERSADGEGRLDEVRALADAARQASPLSGTSRFVVEWPTSQAPDAAPSPVAVGRTRDVVSLAWTGRKLRQAGKIEAATRAYRAAFDLAGRSEAVAADPPTFDENRQPRRYSFPHEGLLEWVARDMVEAGDWSHEQWAEALPGFAVAHMAAARMLLARDRAEADRLIDGIVAEVEGPAAPGFPEAEHRAAGAEALAARSRWADASDRYRRAIDEAGDDATRRMWWVNLAEVAGRSGDEAARASALENAASLGPRDEITRRALRSQDLAGVGRTPPRP